MHLTLKKINSFKEPYQDSWEEYQYVDHEEVATPAGRAANFSRLFRVKKQGHPTLQQGQKYFKIMQEGEFISIFRIVTPNMS